LFFEIECCCVAQPGLKLIGLNHPSALVCHIAEMIICWLSSGAY
jgi:hypothetical protein